MFDKESSRAFTRELTRSIIDVLAVNADERGLAFARRTFSSLTAVLPEARRTERTGPVPSYQNPKKGVILLLGSIT